MSSGAVWLGVVAGLVGTFLTFEIPAYRRRVPWVTLSEVVWTWPMRARLALSIGLVATALDLAVHFIAHTQLAPGLG